MIGLYVVMAIATVAALVTRAYRSLHYMQLEGYRVERYTRHAWESFSIRDSLPAIAIVAVSTVLGVLAVYLQSVPLAWVLAAVALAQAAWYAWSVWSRKAKKPMAFTARMNRLIASTAIITTVAFVIGALKLVGLGLLAGGVDALSFPMVALVLYLSGVLLVWVQPILTVIGVFVVEPIESHIRRGFIEQARQRLAAVDPIVIGIAGSYGKTTTKSALAAALAPKYRVVASPESYNTLLGVTRTINEQLADDTEVLIVEMGARHPGDIAEICDLVEPDAAIITRLGPAHLEYFKTEATVVATKTELLRSLPAGATAVVDADGLSDFTNRDDYAAELTRVSTDAANSPDALVTDIALGGDGTSFAIESAEGDRLEARSPLLGRHAAINSTLAIVLAEKLGVPVDDIRAGIASMPTVPHRLQIVRNDAVIVIDDAFNSNPDGFASALEVLGAIPGRRVLVTPGMVELGSETVSAHQRIARIAAKTCQKIILVGGVYPPEFVDTLLAEGFPASELIKAASLDEATVALGGFISAGDVVLFENDLPDNME